MNVYIEVTYFMNAILILLCFEILSFLLNIQITIKKLCLYVFTYNISIVFLFVDLFTGFLLVYDFILTFFYFRRLIYIYYPVYLFIYFSILSFVQWLLPSSIIFQGVLLIEECQFSYLFVIALIVIIISYFYVYLSRQRIHHQSVKVCLQGKIYEGFIDNGNQVTYRGSPVIFLNREIVGNYSVIDQIWIETASQQERIDLILLSDITIHNQKLHNVYAGIISSSQYDCILNQQLMGGLL
ncbi:hypothetical protein [Massilimicrobiota timonensis]|uniref:Sigma-E processing peptidase SpoIIGA n=1 Tax=Massilimicrobiota timonensis TaxID=1776392 RepID=A0A1Y4SZC3_9FIRM|nr:hypothetical protein [Massilimicrobiota timonensis]OUQ35275.1 hypothetical protein B5E75_04415 [Massilimicrobiota timonensis]